MVRTTDMINKFSSGKEGLSFREADVPPHVYEGEQKRVKELYYGARDSLFKIFQYIKNNEDFSIEPMLPYVKDFVSHIQKMETDSWIQFVYKEDREDDMVMHTATHCVNTTIIAIRVGIGLKMEDDKLETLAILAFFHDVGMLMMPSEIVKKNGKLSPEEFSTIKKHPGYGHKILSKLGEKYKDIADEIYQEHERHDGSGYPAGLKDTQIFVYSIIAGISDMYAALIQPRPYRPRYLPLDAVKEIIATAKNKFPANIIKALVNEFSGFPKGIYVRLNSKEVGRVIATNRLAPLRPVVEILYDANGQKMEKPKVVDMTKHHLLQVVSAYFEEEGQN